MRPRAPPLEAAPGREFVYDETAEPGRAVGFVVDEALVREHAAGFVEVKRPNDGKACETSRRSSRQSAPVSAAIITRHSIHQSVTHQPASR